MKALKHIVLLLLLAALSVSTLMGSEESTSEKPEKRIEAKKIIWHSYDDGLKLAKERDKHVFIDFTAKWCGYCRKMEKEVFTDPRIIDMLNNDFVSIKVDGDSKRQLDIDGYKITEQKLTVQEYGVRGYPTYWFLKSDGTKLGPLNGYRPTDFMLEALTYVKEARYDSTSTETDSTGETADSND